MGHKLILTASLLFLSMNLNGQVSVQVDSLEKGLRKLNFEAIPLLRKALKEEKAQGMTADPSSVNFLKHSRIVRNDVLHSIYLENTKFTHITSAMMVVEGDWESVLDARINFNLFPIPKHLGVGVVINPRFNLRMFLDKESAPIRTPSNVIGITVFKYLSFGMDRGYRFVSGSFFHHSNGQDRGSYNPDGTINLRVGNFAVNYMEGNYMYGRIYYSAQRAFNYYGKIGYQHDFIIGDSKDINPVTGKKALEKEYGQDRINFELSFSRYKKRDIENFNKILDEGKKQQKLSSYEDSPFKFYRVMLEGSIIQAGKMRINIEAKGYIKFNYSPNFMFTVQAGWLGHDYYNIYFNEQTWVFRIGLAAAFLAGPGSRPDEIQKKYLRMMK